jgi:hypothetical protein
MAGRPPGNSAGTSSIRVEVLKELQTLIDDREFRDRIDRGPISETKGREHWVLHLLLRAQELNQSHVDLLIGTAYSNLVARLQTLEDRLQRIEGVGEALGEEVKTRFDGIEASLTQRVAKEVADGVDAAGQKIGESVIGNLDAKWKPVGDSIETFASSSHQLTKDTADTFRVATQNRLLLNENARRMTDLGRDLVALEESLKLSLSKVIEDGLQPLEERIAALESRLGAETNGSSASDGA